MTSYEYLSSNQLVQHVHKCVSWVLLGCRWRRFASTLLTEERDRTPKSSSPRTGRCLSSFERQINSCFVFLFFIAAADWWRRTCVTDALGMFGEQTEMFCQTLQIRFHLSVVVYWQPGVIWPHWCHPHQINWSNDSTVSSKMSPSSSSLQQANG